MNYLLWHYAAKSAQRSPDTEAVTIGGSALTYAELDAASNRLARLLADLGVQRGDRVGILLPKSLQGVITMHAVGKLGAAYIPVDPSAPAKRSAYILEDARVRCLVTDRKRWNAVSIEIEGEAPQVVVTNADGVEGVHAWSDADDLDSSEIARVIQSDHDPAYMLYTSGSTGRPKGVIISHRNAMAFVDWGVAAFDVEAADRLSNHAPHHFDLSVFDIYAALSAGASVHLIPDTVNPFPPVLAKWMAEQEITTWYSVPSALVRLLLHGGLADRDYPALRTVLFAGEVFPLKHLASVMDALPSANFYNLYGPTETNVITYHPVPRPLPADMGSLPIGTACANCDTFVQKADGALAGPGEEGELLARGPTVMLGYWGLPERTKSVLDTDPRVTDYAATVHRTGDLVRVLSDGVTYEFVGRKDHMVKTRGYRVELGEVERVLLEHPDIREAVVIPEPDEEVGARLRGFVVLEGAEDIEESDIVTHCLTRLPRYAVPENWVFLDVLPKTSTGKTDRVALTASPTAKEEG